MINAPSAQNNDRVQKIIEWREAITRLPDSIFFEIMRIYLGEYKSPFNKQRLVEELSAFLRKDSNKAQITALLTDEDITILSAIHHIKNTDFKHLHSFFAERYSEPVLKIKIKNLEERLLIYPVQENEKELLKINPHLEEAIIPFLGFNVLTNPEEKVFTEQVSSINLDTIHLVAILALIKDFPELCKADGSLKKKILAKLEEIFSLSSEEVQIWAESIKTLIYAMKNLNLLQEKDDGIYCVYERLKSFAELSPMEIAAYLCSAASNNFGQNAIFAQAKLFFNLMNSIPQNGLTKEALVRTAILIQSQSSAAAQQKQNSRFAKLVKSVLPVEQSNGAEFSCTMLIDNAIKLGYLYQTGSTESGARVYSRRQFSCVSQEAGISIDAGYTITVLPEVELSKILALSQFLQIQKCNTVAVFEANRKSIMHGFDFSYTPEKIKSILSALTPYPLPQSLIVTIDEWYKNYTSVSLYKGYILHSRGDSPLYSEKNPQLAKHIVSVIAPGVFLMDFESDSQAKNVLNDLDLEYVGAIKSVSEKVNTSNFSKLKNDFSFDFQKEEESKIIYNRASSEEQNSFMQKMMNLVEKMNLSKNIAEGLETRIKNRLIVDSSQLRPESVRLEITEAYGMDYSGKLHLIEKAIAQDYLVELKYDLSGKDDFIVGVPLELKKLDNDASLGLRTIPDNELKSLSVSRAIKVRIIRR